MPEAVIVSAVRTAVGRAYKGSLRATRPDDLAAVVIKEALARVAALDPKEIDDVILGCAMPEGEQGMNVARIAALRAGLPVETSAMTINRFCSSGLQAIALGAERIRAGAAQIIVAGGTESMSLVPMGGNKISPNPWLVDHYPDAYINMGLGTENIARKFGITREQADEFSANSHKKALAAIAAGNFKDETVPVEVKITALASTNGAGGGGGTADQDRCKASHANFPVCYRRIAARGYLDGSACQAEACVSCQRNGHRRKQLSDERRRGGSDYHVGHARKSAGT